MSKKNKTDAPVEFERDKRGLKDIPDTIRRHARMSKRQIRATLSIAGIILILLAAVMIIADRQATAPLEAYESAEIMKESAGAEYIDIINKSRNIELREPESGNPVYLNGRRLILLRRSGVTADDYWFTVLKEKDDKHITAALGARDLIPLETEDDNVLFIFKAKQQEISVCRQKWPDGLSYTPDFIAYNSLSDDYFTGEGNAETGNGDAYTALFHRLMSRLNFIQYTVNDASSEISLFRGTDADLKKAEDNVSRLQIIRMVIIALVVAALGVLAYTLKAKKILTKDAAKQRLIRLTVLCLTIALTACLVFVTVRISNQNDALIRINSRVFPYTVDDTQNDMNVNNAFDQFPAFISEKQSSQEDTPAQSGDAVIDIGALKAYIDKAESERSDDAGEEDSSETVGSTDASQNKPVSGLADGVITFHYYTSDTMNFWTPFIQTNQISKTEELNSLPQVLKTNAKKAETIFSKITTKMHATGKDAAIPGSSAFWRVLYYAAIVLIVALFAGMLYFYRYERDMGFPLINTAILILLMIVTLYPVLNTVAYSFSSGNAASRGKIGLIPQEFTTKSYRDIMDNYMLGAAWISVAKTVLTTVLNLFWTGMLAFTLTRREYALARPITLIMVLTMYVNAGLIPNFLLISQTLGLKNSFWVYIIPTMYSCFNMIIIRTYIASLPGELVESARIDGAGDIRIYWQIIFPLCAPVLATVALFIAVGSWNSWFDTMLYNADVKRLHTLQYVLKGKIATAGATASMAQTSTAAATDLAKTTVNSRTVQCATTVVTALPILVVYPFLQKYFVTGMALGSVKG